MLDLHSKQLQDLLNLLQSGAQAILLLGDEGVGKKTLVQRAVAEFNKPVTKFVLIQFYKLAVADARDIKRETLRMSSIPRVYLLDGDNATDQGYNALLKTLEEPPNNVVFMISSSKPPLPTIVSRCIPVLVPPLTDQELLAALIFKGMTERAANSIVPYARGSVTEAMKVYEHLEEKRRLLPFIKALRDHDLNFILQQVKAGVSRDDIKLMIDLIDDFFLSRYGLVNNELASTIPATPDFLQTVKSALLEGTSPSLALLRAYFAGMG